MTSSSSSYELFYIDQNVSEVPKEVTNVKVDQDTEEIRERAFEECRELKSIIFPENGCLEAIGFHAFFGCKLLREISLPNTISFIGHGAFGDCHNLVSVGLPNGLLGIMQGTFYFCESLKTISIPPSVGWIGQQAFEGCISLESINFSSTTGLEKIGRWAFSDCSSLKSFDMPSTVRVIDNETFRRCASLENLNLPNGELCEICPFAFCSCESLTSVRIPSSVETIGMMAFLNCTSLLSVEVSSIGKLALIEDSAFEGCTSLVNLWLPETEVQTFSKCAALNSLLPGRDGAEMTKVLASRFDSRSHHGAAYFHPFEFRLKSSIVSIDDDNSTESLTDILGMNIYHILSLGTKPGASLFEWLSTRLPKKLLRAKDRNGYTPMDYLCANLSADTTAAVDFVLRTTITDNIPYLGRSVWRDYLEIELRSFQQVNRRDRRSAFRQLWSHYERYERMEALFLLDLAVWKAEIRKVAPLPVARNNCRIHCGADVVISQVLRYLKPIEYADE